MSICSTLVIAPYINLTRCRELEVSEVDTERVLAAAMARLVRGSWRVRSIAERCLG